MGFTSFQGPDFRFAPLSGEGPLAAQLVAWYQQARASGRVPCVYVTAPWCPPSVKLEQALGDPRMQRALRELDCATLDIDRGGAALQELGFRLASVPVFFLLDAEGRPSDQITGAAWKQDTPEGMGPPLERFFDQARAARPAPAPAPRTAPGSRVPGVLMLLIAAALIGLGAWFKVSSDEAQRQGEDQQRMQREIHESIQRSLQKSREKSGG